MTKKALPAIRLDRKEGLTLRAPKSALSRWDKSIAAAAKKTNDAQVEITILTEIGDETWGGFSAATAKRFLDAAGDAPVLVTLNSPGGDAFEGIAIYNLLRNHPGAVTVNIIGMAASAASVIAMAGDRIEMQPATSMMIHSAWGLVVGNEQEMREFAEILEMLDRSVAGVYAARTGMSEDDVLELMRAETWMSAKEAKDQGFCDVAHSGKKKDPAKQSAQQTPSLSAAPGERQRPVVYLSAKPAPGASGHHTLQGANMPTPQERIEALMNKRAATVARMEAVSKQADDEGRTMNAAEQEEFDTLDAEVTSIDAQLKRDKRMVELSVQSARPVNPAAGTDGGGAAGARQPNGAMPANSNIVAVRSNLQPGVPFARYAMAMAMAQGHKHQALQIVQSNQRWMQQTPQIAQFLMAAIGAGTSTGAAWADDLVYAQNLSADFIEYLRPMTIVGKLEGKIRRAPFNIRVGSATSGTSAYWVGEGKPIPLSKMGTDVMTLTRTKLAGLTSITEELARDSSPSAELLVRDDLRDAVVQLMDQSFIDPGRAENPGVSPASITSGVSAVAATGTTAAHLRADIATMFGNFIAANLPTTGGVWIMTSTTALALSLMTNALGQPEFNGLTPEGGTFLGYPAIVSQSANVPGSPTFGDLLIFALPREIFLADDGEVDIRVSAEAAIQMDSAPTQDAVAGTGASMVSMFQTDSLAVRAVRFVNWKKRRSAAVQYITNALYRA